MRSPRYDPAKALKALFRDTFQCRGRDFGSPSRGVLGISDGNEGVQWNAGYYPRDGAVWLGVNLEGMKYDDWPVTRRVAVTPLGCMSSWLSSRWRRGRPGAECPSGSSSRREDLPDRPASTVLTGTLPYNGRLPLAPFDMSGAGPVPPPVCWTVSTWP